MILKKSITLNALFRDVVRVTHLYSEMSLVFPEDTVSVDEVLKAVKNIIHIIYHINEGRISANSIKDMRSAVKLRQRQKSKREEILEITK